MTVGALETPVGPIAVEVRDGAIVRVTWRDRVPPSPPDPLLDEALRQLRAYFAGDLAAFDVPIDLGVHPESTHAVLTTLHESVALGETVTYGELADRSGTGLPARAIGGIMGANPVPIVVPCHRVVASDGLGGYSGGRRGHGLETKRWLLEHEGAMPAALF